MATLEDRVTTVEAQTDKVVVAIEGVQQEIAALRTDMANLATRAELAALRTELRGDMDTLRRELRGDMDTLRTELRGDTDTLRTDLRELSRRWDGWFLWLAGTQVATLLAIIGVLAGVLFR